MAKMTAPRAGYFTLSLDDIDFQRGGEEFISELKRDVPPGCRDYCKKRKVWTIRDIFYRLVWQKVQDYFVPPNHDLFEQHGATDAKKSTRR